MTRRDITVIVPVYGELASLSNVTRLEEVLGTVLTGIDWEIIVSSNGTTEAESTRERAALESLNLRRTRYISSVERGRGIAVWRAVEASNAEFAAIYCIDFGWAPSFLCEAIATLRADEAVHAVIGSKGHPESYVRRPLLRTAASSLINTYVRRRFKVPYRDTQGVKVFRRQKSLALELLKPRYNFFSDTEFLIRAHQAGCVVRELPVRVVDFRRRTTVRLSSLVEFWRESSDFAAEPCYPWLDEVSEY